MEIRYLIRTPDGSIDLMVGRLNLDKVILRCQK